jgi:predicted NBD/HSP70 family sugar kinase
VGIATPGIVTPTGVILDAPGRGWRDLPLAEELAASLGLPVRVANDANAAALGELTFGNASPAGFLVVTLGQGLGAGLVLDGSLVMGHRFAAGELGHVTAVDPGHGALTSVLGPPLRCVCGRQGCLETVVSIPGLRGRIEAAGARAAETLAAAGSLLGAVLSPVASAVNVADIVVRGPADLVEDRFLGGLRRALAERTIGTIASSLQIRRSALGQDAALVGAAVLVLSSELGIT